VRLVQTYRLPRSTLWLPDNLDRLLRVWLVQTSRMLGNSDRLLRVRLVQMHLLHRSTSLLPDNSDRLPRVIFLRQVRMYLFNLLLIPRTHKWYLIQVHWIMTLHRRKCYLIHRIMALPQSKTNLLPGVFARHPTVGPLVSQYLNHLPVSGFNLLTYEIQIGALNLAICALCLLSMSCRRDVVSYYSSLKGIR